MPFLGDGSSASGIMMDLSTSTSFCQIYKQKWHFRARQFFTVKDCPAQFKMLSIPGYQEQNTSRSPTSISHCGGPATLLDNPTT